ncbi:hypothetical protein BRCON_2334 [Candidatus Sumerlaea chitinivorans]|uniref:Uncharacterized protein n=1 Tax=Sumerlaea chitinivorans TaxID=2250252 RepID=A0A2Z4Y7C0_SUMC1|nr:hypothetical protein BRCON_2334 [Candidatus Sumerlaea chitinivorans]
MNLLEADGILHLITTNFTSNEKRFSTKKCEQGVGNDDRASI